MGCTGIPNGTDKLLRYPTGGLAHVLWVKPIMRSEDRTDPSPRSVCKDHLGVLPSSVHLLQLSGYILPNTFPAITGVQGPGGILDLSSSLPVSHCSF